MTNNNTPLLDVTDANVLQMTENNYFEIIVLQNCMCRKIQKIVREQCLKALQNNYNTQLIIKDNSLYINNNA